MDYPVAACVRRALHTAVERSALGYPSEDADSGLPEAFAAWVARRHGWTVEPGLVRTTPDVVGGLATCLRALTRPGAAVLLPTPLYPPLLHVVPALGRSAVPVPCRADGRWDLDALGDAFARHRPEALVLCNPHNPTGQVATSEELHRVAELAERSGCRVLSDEIHADLVLQGRHRPFASLGPEVAARTVTFMSASKAFNLAGLRCAVAVPGSHALATSLSRAPTVHRDPVGALGVAASLAAWSEEGSDWLERCLRVLASNRSRVVRRLCDAGLRVIEPGGTFLAWVDCRALRLDVDPAVFFLSRARVAVSSGARFGPGGEGFVRLNFATSPALLDAVLDRLVDAVATRGR
jgi:cystathionine beta-lyase